MANPVETSAANPLSAAVFGDPSKLNFFNANEQDQQEYQNALKQSLTALEERYARPNWFKIAAGFAKPQLGGFMAGLGSAAEAMGENVEQQRAAQLPISQLRAQLAMSKIGMGQNKLVADKFQEWKDKGSNPEELMGLRDLAMATAPNAPVTAAIGKRYDSLVTERQLASSEQGNAMQRIQTALALHKQPDPADLLLMQGGSRTINKSPAKGDQAFPDAGSNLPSKPSAIEQPTPSAVAPLLQKNTTGAEKNVSNKPLFDMSGDLSYENLTQAQKDVIDQQLVANKLRPIMSTDAGKASWEQQRTSNPNFSKFISGLNTIKPSQQISSASKTEEDNTPYPILNQIPTIKDFEEMPADLAAKKLETITNNQKNQEEISKGVVASLAPYGNPTLYNPLMQSLTKTEKLLTGNQAAADKVQDILGTGTLMSQIEKSIQKGGTLNFSGGLLSGSVGISLPSETWEAAGLPKGLASYANQLATEYAKQSVIKAKMNGVNFNSIPVTEFSAMLSANPNLHLRSDAALSLIHSDKADAYYQNKMHHAIQSEYQKKVDKANEATPYTSIIHHSAKYKNLQSAWDYEKATLADQDLQRSLKP